MRGLAHAFDDDTLCHKKAVCSVEVGSHHKVGEQQAAIGNAGQLQ